jgi:hypothetical protein
VYPFSFFVDVGYVAARLTHARADRRTPSRSATNRSNASLLFPPSDAFGEKTPPLDAIVDAAHARRRLFFKPHS